MSTPDIRISNPNSTSLYESLTLKTVEKNKDNFQEINKSPEDVIVSEKPNSGKIPSSGVNFEAPVVRSLPLIDEETGKTLLFQVDKSGNYVKDKDDNFLIVESGGKPIYIQVDQNNKPLLDENEQYIILNPDDLNNTDDISSTDKTTPVKNASVKNESIMPLTNLETGEVLFFKVDDKGHPLTDKKGDYILDPEKGQPVFVKVDNNGNPLKDPNGKFIIVTQTGDTVSDVPQSFNRLAIGMLGKKLAQGAINKTSGLMIKGVSVGIPFTKASFGFGVKQAVVSAVGKELQGIKAAKSGSTTVVNALNTATKTASEGAVKTLTTAGRLGKGVETLGLKEASKLAGGHIKAVKHGFEGFKAVTAEVAEGGVKAVGGVAKKTVVGATEKALRKGVEEGIESGIKTVIRRSGKEIAETVTTKGVQKALSVTAEKAAVGASSKFIARAGSKIAAVSPVIGVTAGAAITVWDAKDAIEKTKDNKASFASKSLAWTTVGLDAVSTVAEFSGKGKPVGWVATGLSIGTSVLSDYLR